ncbi:hypothetical protein V8G54_013859 [Vigna mungo]|uniref:Uncharacterized protein n=1 Tax=Vigna mungo TaxID=3915 RepID=A0AAQ3NFN4_VIGMU
MQDQVEEFLDCVFNVEDSLTLLAMVECVHNKKFPVLLPLCGWKTNRNLTSPCVIVIAYSDIPDYHGVKVYDKGRASGVLDCHEVKVYDKRRASGVVCGVGCDFPAAIDKPISNLTSPCVVVIAYNDTCVSILLDLVKPDCHRVKVYAKRGASGVVSNTFGEMTPTKPLANQRGRNDAPKRRRNNNAGRKRELLSNGAERDDFLHRQRWTENHFNGGESFEGRNFNGGKRVLKDLSAKGGESFEKGEREFRRVRVSEIKKCQKILHTLFGYEPYPGFHSKVQGKIEANINEWQETKQKLS